MDTILRFQRKPFHWLNMHESLTDEYRDTAFYLVGDFSSINYRITSITPNTLIIIHHQMNNRGHHLPHDLSAPGYLAAVDVVAVLLF